MKYNKFEGNIKFKGNKNWRIFKIRELMKDKAKCITNMKIFFYVYKKDINCQLNCYEG